MKAHLEQDSNRYHCSFLPTQASGQAQEWTLYATKCETTDNFTLIKRVMDVPPTHLLDDLHHCFLVTLTIFACPTRDRNRKI